MNAEGRSLEVAFGGGTVDEVLDLDAATNEGTLPRESGLLRDGDTEYEIDLFFYEPHGNNVCRIERALPNTPLVADLPTLFSLETAMPQGVQVALAPAANRPPTLEILGIKTCFDLNTANAATFAYILEILAEGGATLGGAAAGDEIVDWWTRYISVRRR